MADTTESVFYLPSYFIDDMSPAQCRRASRVQPGASHGRTRKVAGSNLNNSLLHGSTPEIFSEFDPSLGAIGDGPRRQKTLGEMLNSSSIDDIKRSGANFAPRNKTKFARLFWPRHSDVALVWVIHPDDRIRAFIDGLMPDEYRPRCDLRRVKPLQLYHHGDMSNLRPGDQGMDAAMCTKFYNMSTASSGQMPFTTTHPSNSEASTSKKVRFELEEPLSRQSTDEQRADCRAKSREWTTNEAVLGKSIHDSVTRILEAADEDISSLTRLCTLSNIIHENITSSSAPNGVSAIAEQSSTADDSEAEEEE